MVLVFPTVQQVVSAAKDNPHELKQMLEKEPSTLDALMRDAIGEVKYIRVTEEDRKRLDDAKKKGIAEGLIIGLAVALFLRDFR